MFEKFIVLERGIFYSKFLSCAWFYFLFREIGKLKHRSLEKNSPSHDRHKDSFGFDDHVKSRNPRQLPDRFAVAVVHSVSVVYSLCITDLIFVFFVFI